MTIKKIIEKLLYVKDIAEFIITSIESRKHSDEFSFIDVPLEADIEAFKVKYPKAYKAISFARSAYKMITRLMSFFRKEKAIPKALPEVDKKSVDKLS